MDIELIKANRSLEESISILQAQVAKQEKMIKLCLQVISEFGHFLPSIIEDFNNEMDKIGSNTSE